MPDEVGTLTNLEILWLHDNHLTRIPESIGDLTGLTMLTLRVNQVGLRLPVLLIVPAAHSPTHPEPPGQPD